MNTRTIGSVMDSNWRPRDRWTRSMTYDEAVRRVRSDYLELTGLKLTSAQAARFWSLAADLAAAVLDDLTAAGFLVCTDGLYARR
ncbi:MAG TPA: hypothetical protein VFJ02_19435 [Vicinamibacterales bacterium]|nr:hypothetical protein [Vicinamibacterales bacterium]